MTVHTDAATAAKQTAARAALDRVQDGMTLGLGSGSTAEVFVALLGPYVRERGWRVSGVPTSSGTQRVAKEAGVPLVDLNDVVALDLAVDGADEIGPGLALIKGGGACLLREKIIAAAAQRFLVIAHASKMADQLGAFPLPVEVDPFGAEATRARLVAFFADHGFSAIEPRTRMCSDGTVLLTDGGHHIFDCALGAIADPNTLNLALSAVPGVLDHGLFVDIADEALIAGPDGVEALAR